jgi:hypothetical protein
MGWRAARLGPSFYLCSWKGAVMAVAVMAVATLAQAEGWFSVRRRPRGTSQDIRQTALAYMSSRVAGDLTAAASGRGCCQSC